jgi:PhnB protein
MTKKQNPFGLHTITPYLIVDEIPTLIKFLQKVFDAESRGEPEYRDDGTVKHAEVKIGDSVVMMGEPTGNFEKMPATLYLYVDDCDRTYQKALEAGATSIMEPENFPHGDRYGGVKDCAGNKWWIVTHIGKE